MDWAESHNVGFSNVVSLGAEADIEFGEVLDYMVADPRTENIFLYIEGIKNARRFMSALRAAARCKPVLLMKVGRHPAAREAARLHSGAQVGSDDVFDAALRRAGVVRLANVGQMYAAAQALFSRFRPRGNRLAIITNGGGPGVIAADHAADLSIPLAKLQPASVERLDATLPGHWSRCNPLDVLGDAGPGRFGDALKACIDDDNVDGILLILTPQVMSNPTGVAKTVIDAAKESDKPIVVCWMGGNRVTEARGLFQAAGIPSFRTPEPAVELFSHISAYYRAQKLLLQTPSSISEQTPPRIESARMVIETALMEGRNTLTEMESKAILAAFQIPIAQTVMARSATEAMVLSEELGLPVAMKVASPQIVHKADAGGVRLNVETLAGVRDAYNGIMAGVATKLPAATILGITIERMVKKENGRELKIGIRRDPIFGPTICFGPGGTRVEVETAERAVALPPLNPVLVQDLLESTTVSARLGKFHHMPPVDMNALESVLLRVSAMACELPWIREMEINPLIVDENGAVAVDARIELANVPLTAGRYDHMAIHPYPLHLATKYQANDGTLIHIRPIRPDDAEMEQVFVQGLSPDSRYLRFMNTIRELSPAQLARMTQIDYDREMAFVATTEHEGQVIEIGVCRYAINPDGESCEFAIVVGDQWQGRGLARRLKYMTGDFLAENTRMLKFVSSLGFILSSHPEDSGLRQGLLTLN